MNRLKTFKKTFLILAIIGLVISIYFLITDISTCAPSQCDYSEGNELGFSICASSCRISYENTLTSFGVDLLLWIGFTISAILNKKQNNNINIA